MTAHTVKVCRTCRASKGIRAFYRDRNCADGHRPDCKECHCAAVLANRELKAEHYRALERARRITPEYRAANAARMRAWRATPEGKQSTEESIRICRMLKREAA